MVSPHFATGGSETRPTPESRIAHSRAAVGGCPYVKTKSRGRE